MPLTPGKKALDSIRDRVARPLNRGFVLGHDGKPDALATMKAEAELAAIEQEQAEEFFDFSSSLNRAKIRALTIGAKKNASRRPFRLAERAKQTAKRHAKNAVAKKSRKANR